MPQRFSSDCYLISDAPGLLSAPTKKPLQQQQQQHQCDVGPGESCYKDTYAQLQSSGTWDLANTTSHYFQTFRESVKHQWAKRYSAWWQMGKTGFIWCEEKHRQVRRVPPAVASPGTLICSLCWIFPLGVKMMRGLTCCLPPSPDQTPWGVWDRQNPLVLANSNPTEMGA